MLEKNKSTPKKKLGIAIGSTVIHPQPNNIGSARQQPRDWGSLFNFSESGWGRGHSYYLLALSLDYMEFAMEATTEWEIGGGGPYSSLGTGDKCPPPQISEFCLGVVGGTSVFYPSQADFWRFKIPLFSSPSHTHSPVCAPPQPPCTFSFSSNRFLCFVFRVLTASSGGGGGGLRHVPLRPPLGVALIMII